LKGLEVSPYALLIALVAYLLKRWWDNQENFKTQRNSVYLAAVKANSKLMQAYARFDAKALEDIQSELDSATLEFKVEKLDENLTAFQLAMDELSEQSSQISLFGSEKVYDTFTELYSSGAKLHALSSKKVSDEEELEKGDALIAANHNFINSVRDEIEGLSLRKLLHKLLNR
jgi:hypothetical protein